MRMRSVVYIYRFPKAFATCHSRSLMRRKWRRRRGTFPREGMYIVFLPLGMCVDSIYLQWQQIYVINWYRYTFVYFAYGNLFGYQNFTPRRVGGKKILAALNILSGFILFRICLHSIPGYEFSPFLPAINQLPGHLMYCDFPLRWTGECVVIFPPIVQQQ